MQYSFEKTIELSNAVVRIYRPKLTEEEKESQMQRIKNAAASLIIGVRKK